MTDHLTALVDALDVDEQLATPVDLRAAIARSLTAEAAVGWTYVSLLHGDAENADDAAKLAIIRRVVDQFIDDRTLAATRGGNDWTTWCLRGHRAGLAQAAIIGCIELHGDSWWRWSTDGHPPGSLAEGRPVSRDASKREATP